MIQLDRNDPCHCGSGKKYKKCHLEADQRNRAPVRESQPEPGLEPMSYDPGKVATAIQRLSEQGPVQDRQAFRAILEEPVFQYVARREEIDAATAQLEAHRAEFEKLLADVPRYSDLVRSVFSEECFAPLRFSASDVQDAFDKVGYPAMMSRDDQTVERLRAAILHIADDKCRKDLSMRLLLQVPEFVAAGRYLEAWVIQLAIYETAEKAEESNGFLFCMFSHGYDAWAVNRKAADEALLLQLGLDPKALQGMDPEKLHAWMQAQRLDPANTAMIEEVLRKNPHLQAESAANLEAMERNSAKLLEREDSRFLLLTEEETEPWYTRFCEDFNEQECSFDPESEAGSRKVFDELVLPLVREMAESIFTPERIQQLLRDLKEYQSDLFKAGDVVNSNLVLGAITYVEREDSPGLNTFLISLCWRSIESMIKSISSAALESMD
jgi:hypothetical protein